MGGLRRKMPVTCWTFLIGMLAIAGVPFLSGFYSKDAILASVLGFTWTHRSHGVLFLLPAVAAALTAFYMLRLYLLTFRTTARDEHVHTHAHESPKVMWVPLVILAVLSIGIAWFGACRSVTHWATVDTSIQAAAGWLVSSPRPSPSGRSAM